MMSCDESFYPRHGVGLPDLADYQLAALQDQLAALNLENALLKRRLREYHYDPSAAQSDVGREREDCAAIVDGFAKEAAYSGERHVLELAAAAIRARK